MATAYSSVAAEFRIMMSIPVSRRAVRKLAPDQKKFAKPRKVTKAEAKRIAKRGYERILAETGSKEFAKDFKNTMNALPGSISW